jgi:hypothetical protein
VKIAPSWSEVLRRYVGQVHQGGRDIIPPFGGFSGQNWTPQGMAIFANGCAGGSGLADGSDVPICRATSSASHSYVKIAPSWSEVLGRYVGQVHQGGRDIIPSFGGFAGQNWTVQGIAIYASRCDPPAVAIPAGGAIGGLGLAALLGLVLLLRQTGRKSAGAG